MFVTHAFLTLNSTFDGGGVLRQSIIAEGKKKNHVGRTFYRHRGFSTVSGVRFCNCGDRRIVWYNTFCIIIFWYEQADNSPNRVRCKVERNNTHEHDETSKYDILHREKRAHGDIIFGRKIFVVNSHNTPSRSVCFVPRSIACVILHISSFFLSLSISQTTS